MAKFINKILDYIGLEEAPAEEAEVMDEESFTQQEEYAPEEPININSRKRGKVVDITSANRVKVILDQPMNYDDTQNIIDNLRLRKLIIVNLEMLEVDTAQRVLDFVSGAVYALRGNIQKVSKGIFVLVPNNIDISGNVQEEENDNGFFNVQEKRAR